ncbi:hypothetical protein CDAR_451001, partial [Caerostris darwini]
METPIDLRDINRRNVERERLNIYRLLAERIGPSESPDVEPDDDQKYESVEFEEKKISNVEEYVTPSLRELKRYGNQPHHPNYYNPHERHVPHQNFSNPNRQEFRRSLRNGNHHYQKSMSGPLSDYEFAMRPNQLVFYINPDYKAYQSFISRYPRDKSTALGENTLSKSQREITLSTTKTNTRQEYEDYEYPIRAELGQREITLSTAKQEYEDYEYPIRIEPIPISKSLDKEKSPEESTQQQSSTSIINTQKPIIADQQNSEEQPSTKRENQQNNQEKIITKDDTEQNNRGSPPSTAAKEQANSNISSSAISVGRRILENTKGNRETEDTKGETGKSPLVIEVNTDSSAPKIIAQPDIGSSLPFKIERNLADAGKKKEYKGKNAKKLKKKRPKYGPGITDKKGGRLKPAEDKNKKGSATDKKDKSNPVRGKKIKGGKRPVTGNKAKGKERPVTGNKAKGKERPIAGNQAKGKERPVISNQAKEKER